MDPLRHTPTPNPLPPTSKSFVYVNMFELNFVASRVNLSDIVLIDWSEINEAFSLRLSHIGVLRTQKLPPPPPVEAQGYQRFARFKPGVGI